MALLAAAGAMWFGLERSCAPGEFPEPAAIALARPQSLAPSLDESPRAEAEAPDVDSLAAPYLRDESRVPLAPAPIGDPANTAMSAAPHATPRPGTLILRAFDRTQLGPLRGYGVRLASDTRFADRRSDDVGGVLELALTPGSYALLFRSRGYEPVEIPSVEIASGERVRLPAVELLPGSGRIRVEVVGVLDLERQLRIELIGDGRHPCARCTEGDGVIVVANRAVRTADRGVRIDPRESGEPKARPDLQERVDRAWNRTRACPVCGFARDASSAFLRNGESFAFANLASGPYALRLVDADERTIGAQRDVMLRAGTATTIVFDASETRTVSIEFIDVDGRSLAAEWSRRIAGRRGQAESSEALVVMESDEVLRLVLSDEHRDVARARVVPPMPDGRAGATALGVGSGRLTRRAPKDLEPGEIVDRERTANDVLRPEASSPRFTVTEIECEIRDDGLVSFGPIATSSLSLRVTSRRASGEVVLPASRGDTHVRIPLHAQ